MNAGLTFPNVVFPVPMVVIHLHPAILRKLPEVTGSRKRVAVMYLLSTAAFPDLLQLDPSKLLELTMSASRAERRAESITAALLPRKLTEPTSSAVRSSVTVELAITATSNQDARQLLSWRLQETAMVAAVAAMMAAVVAVSKLRKRKELPSAIQKNKTKGARVSIPILNSH